MVGKLKEKCAVAYMDDLLIAGKNFDERMQKLEQTFELLTQAELTLNIQKCKFFETVINYLDIEISEEGVRPGKGKIEAIEIVPRTKECT